MVRTGPDCARNIVETDFVFDMIRNETFGRKVHLLDDRVARALGAHVPFDDGQHSQEHRRRFVKRGIPAGFQPGHDLFHRRARIATVMNVRTAVQPEHF